MRTKTTYYSMKGKPLCQIADVIHPLFKTACYQCRISVRKSNDLTAHPQ